MSDIALFFSSLETHDTEFATDQLGAIVERNEGSFPELKAGGVAILFVPEYRGNNSISSSFQSLDGFRIKFYQLSSHSDWKFPIYDLGNIIPGKELKDTHFAVEQVVFELVKKRVIPIIIGGSQDLTFAMYKGYSRLEQTINTCAVDYKLDLGDVEKDIHSEGYLSHMLLQRPCYLFNHANIGLQIPYAGIKDLELFERLYFDACRLGEFNADFKRAEPHLRNSDFLTIDFNSIKASETQTKYAQPNGFYAEQICQIAKYAGISDKLTSIGIFNHIGTIDSNTADFLLAELVWYFIDGFSQRKADFPVGSKSQYTRHIVAMDDFEEEIVFYKSNKSDRWWLEVPYPHQEGMKYERHHLIPCDYEDYEKAMSNELPDLWWKTYQKLI
ncbi:MAG: formimidoylglutamase [Bacteroidetes bacterium]|nr:formimidoylglutamase [Bacteroidota bacterium]